jgi:uncharacterized protein (DUF934 family)
MATRKKSLRLKMSKVILDSAIVDDAWTLVAAADAEIPATAKIIVPLKVWQAKPVALQGKTVGVSLDSADDPGALVSDINSLPIIAVNFPTFKDGRGYSTAYLLRTRYGYTGELRAIGDIQRDQLFYLKRVGFNAFAIRADKDIEAALKSLNDFSDVYQGSVVQASPLFRRRQITASAS